MAFKLGFFLLVAYGSFDGSILGIFVWIFCGELELRYRLLWF